VDFTEPRTASIGKSPARVLAARRGHQGGSKDWRAKISDIDVDGHNYSVSRSGGYVTVKIGDADYYVDGTQVYRISYRIQFYDDRLPEPTRSITTSSVPLGTRRSTTSSSP
jgi:hypothetical protein